MPITLTRLTDDGQAVVMQFMALITNLMQSMRVNADKQIDVYSVLAEYICDKIAKNPSKYAKMPESHRFTFCKWLIIKVLSGNNYHFDGPASDVLHKQHNSKRINNAAKTKPCSRQLDGEDGYYKLLKQNRFPNPVDVAICCEEKEQILININ